MPVKAIVTWGVGIFVFLSTYIMGTMIGNEIGVPAIFNFPEEMIYYDSYGSEHDSATTAFGWGLLVFSGVMGFGATYAGALEKPSSNWFGWLTGSFILMIGGVLLWTAFEGTDGTTGLIGNFLNLILYASAAYSGYKVARTTVREKFVS